MDHGLCICFSFGCVWDNFFCQQSSTVRVLVGQGLSHQGMIDWGINGWDDCILLSFWNAVGERSVLGHQKKAVI
jgi:hypothetical protein